MAERDAEGARAPVQRLQWLGMGLAGLIILFDQLSKAWVLYVFDLPRRGNVELSPIMDLTMVWNRGISFGLLGSDSDLGRWLLTVFSLGISVFMLWWLRQARRLATAIALGMVIGGAIGNVIDRIFRGAVVDFLNFSDIWFPWVFNIADACISVGFALLILDSLLARDEA